MRCEHWTRDDSRIPGLNGVLLRTGPGRNADYEPGAWVCDGVFEETPVHNDDFCAECGKCLHCESGKLCWTHTGGTGGAPHRWEKHLTGVEATP